MQHLPIDDFSADFMPEQGGRLNQLSWRGIPIFHASETQEQWETAPAIYGIPVLFPPNRIQDGTFSFHGQTCKLPINEPARNNHIHGIALMSAWTFTQTAPNQVRMTFTYGDEAPEFNDYPFPCTLNLTYSFSQDAMAQTLDIINLGDTTMPLAVGFHTALSCPETMTITGDDTFLDVPTDRHLPSGEKRAWSEDLRPNCSFAPGPLTISRHFHSTVPPQAILEYRHLTLTYTPDPKLTWWMLWKPNSTCGFVCPEPMNIPVNVHNNHLAELPELGPNLTMRFTSIFQFRQR